VDDPEAMYLRIAGLFLKHDIDDGFPPAKRVTMFECIVGKCKVNIAKVLLFGTSEAAKTRFGHILLGAVLRNFI
jgi:hypothetical protein